MFLSDVKRKLLIFGELDFPCHKQARYKHERVRECRRTDINYTQVSNLHFYLLNANLDTLLK